MDREWDSSSHDIVVETTAASVLAEPLRQVAESPPVVRPFSELGGGVARALLISWGVFALVVLAAFGGKLDVLFNLGVVFAFGAVFFGVPLVLLRIKRKAHKPKAYVDTPNGRMSQTEALLQIVMVPVILSLGMAVIGYMATHQ